MFVIKYKKYLTTGHKTLQAILFTPNGCWSLHTFTQMAEKMLKAPVWTGIELKNLNEPFSYMENSSASQIAKRM